MATSLLTGGSSSAFPGDAALKGAGVLTFVFNLASATTAKGSALATGDIFNCIRVPIGWVVSDVVVTPTVLATAAGVPTISKFKIDVGYTAQNTAYASSIDCVGSTVAVPANGATIQSSKTAKKFVPTTTGQSIDVKIHSTSGTATTGTIRLDAYIFDATANTTG